MARPLNKHLIAQRYKAKGFTYKQIADLLKVSQTTAKNYIWKAEYLQKRKDFQDLSPRANKLLSNLNIDNIKQLKERWNEFRRPDFHHPERWYYPFKGCNEGTYKELKALLNEH